MSLTQKINEDLKEAMKAKDKACLSTLRMLKAAVKNRQVEKGGELEDKEIEAVIASLIKKSQESAEEFKKGGRHDLAAKEEGEAKILLKYLPEQLTRVQIETQLKEIISELSADSFKDMGKVMKVAMSRMAGKVQGKEVNEIAKKLLS
jgi:uncharacterized protein YqeY